MSSACETYSSIAGKACPARLSQLVQRLVYVAFINPHGYEAPTRPGFDSRIGNLFLSRARTQL